MHVSVFRRVALLTVALLLGAWLRLWFIHTYPQVNGDSLLYGEMAKNLILHGIYGRVQDGSVHPTLIRLPGYPLFLAACFRIFGMENYRAVLYLQAAVDLASCLLIAGCVRLLRGARQAWIALFLAVLCPFTANYVSNALSETLSIFCVALALYGMALLMTRAGGEGDRVVGICIQLCRPASSGWRACWRLRFCRRSWFTVRAMDIRRVSDTAGCARG